MADDVDEQPADRLPERGSRSRWRLRLALDADRRLLAGGLLLATFATLVAAGTLVPGAERAVRAGDAVETSFQAFLTATITGVTLVLTLNQLVLSQEFGAVGDQRERMDEALQFRDDAAAAIDAAVAPARPAQFLRAFIEVAESRARELLAAAPADGEVGQAVTDLTDSVTANARRASTDLDGATFGEFEVISAVLDFNYSRKVVAAKRLDAEYGGRLDQQADDALAQLIEVLELFGSAREHFKTLYFQWELINLSRVILWTALPALGVSLFMLGFFRVATFDTTVASLDGVVLVYAFAATVALTPFVVLLVYVLRIATVTKRTLAIGPFILRDTAVSEVEWGR